MHRIPETMTALELALLFHATYERLAPSHGYETRTQTRVFDPNSNNGRLMVAVCTELLSKHLTSEDASLGRTPPSAQEMAAAKERAHFKDEGMLPRSGSWREGGIWLLSDETDVHVLVERAPGVWVEVMGVPYQIDGIISHIVEAARIDHCFLTKRPHT